MDRRPTMNKSKRKKPELAKSNTQKGDMYDSERKKIDFYLSSSESQSTPSSSERSSASVPHQATQAKIMIKKLESYASELSSGREGRRSKNEQHSLSQFHQNQSPLDKRADLSDESDEKDNTGTLRTKTSKDIKAKFLDLIWSDLKDHDDSGQLSKTPSNVKKGKDARVLYKDDLGSDLSRDGARMPMPFKQISEYASPAACGSQSAKQLKKSKTMQALVPT